MGLESERNTPKANAPLVGGALDYNWQLRRRQQPKIKT
jgi:hypothetical protein